MNTVRRRRAIPVTRRRSTVKRQAFGNFVSAMQQRDATNIVVNTNEEVTLSVPAQCKEATIVRNINSLMTNCQMFYNYATMYDQFKLNAVRVSVEMTYIGNQLLNSSNFPSICTAWDRNGIRPVQQQDANGVYGWVLPEYSIVSSYSSANERTLYYGSRWSVVRQLDASSMMEKSIYVGTVNTKDILTTDNLYGAWNPQFLISIKSPREVSVSSYCILQIHYQFDITLRGCRKVPISTAELQAKLQPNPNFIGYTPNNDNILVKTAQTGVYVASAQNNNANPQLPTVNPNMIDAANGQPATNGGIYMPPAGVANGTLKL